MSLRPASAYQVRAAVKAAQLLADALTCARVANCPRLAKAIRFAQGSAGGALRHAKRRQAAGTCGHSEPSKCRRIEKNGQGVDFRASSNAETGDFEAKTAFWWKTGQYA